MFNWLHTFTPEPILISLGPINIYWYGVFLILGILAASLVTIKLATRYDIKKDLIIDSIFWLVVGGIIGARIYHVMLELPYYLSNPLDIFKLWQGGLAIHGAIIAGVFMIWYIAKREKTDPWFLTALFLPGLALAQAIGRWGNFFNQELYGRPTDLPWGIPIEPLYRTTQYYSNQYFHPTFLYESLGNLLIFFALLSFHKFLQKTADEKKKRIGWRLLTVSYLVLYSILRFTLEFVRIDATPEFFGLRLPQIVSLLIIAACGLYLAIILLKIKKEKAA